MYNYNVCVTLSTACNVLDNWIIIIIIIIIIMVFYCFYVRNNVHVLCCKDVSRTETGESHLALGKALEQLKAWLRLKASHTDTRTQKVVWMASSHISDMPACERWSHIQTQGFWLATRRHLFHSSARFCESVVALSLTCLYLARTALGQLQCICFQSTLPVSRSLANCTYAPLKRLSPGPKRPGD